MKKAFKWHVDDSIESVLSLVKNEHKAEMKKFLLEAKKLKYKTEACKVYYLASYFFKN
jgi:hypothetical protein